MLRIDAHQHFWKYNAVRDSWITDEMRIIQRNFLPEDVIPILQSNAIDGCVAVQADQSEEENRFLIDLAQKNSFIKGIVGWIDLQADTINKRLEFYKSFPLIKGFRHILQGEKDRALMLQPSFIKGIRALQRDGFTYDILILPDQLPFALELIAAFPEQRFVIDHLAKPAFRTGNIEKWKEHITGIGQYKNVFCKLSGLVTEADWKSWKKEDFIPCLDHVVNVFGTERLMFGSDWPVCLVAASYNQVFQLINEYFQSFSNNEKENIFGGNAIRFYNL